MEKFDVYNIFNSKSLNEDYDEYDMTEELKYDSSAVVEFVADKVLQSFSQALRDLRSMSYEVFIKHSITYFKKAGFDENIIKAAFPPETYKEFVENCIQDTYWGDFWEDWKEYLDY